ncbi:hypothetical protein AB1Y20_019380 [Prymnesium parvum]|uniref:Uncharacterized protein n=1 Tax=Prymnesium parvum TaxID=97485 RepID=A0AB34JU62_PRYPA
MGEAVCDKGASAPPHLLPPLFFREQIDDQVVLLPHRDVESGTSVLVLDADLRPIVNQKLRRLDVPFLRGPHERRLLGVLHARTRRVRSGCGNSAFQASRRGRGGESRAGDDRALVDGWRKPRLVEVGEC